MSKNKTKKRASRFELLDWMNIFKSTLKEFVDQPTEENLQNMMSIAEEYKDDWIKIVSKKGGLGDEKPSNLLSKAFLNDSDHFIQQLEGPPGQNMEISKDKKYDYENIGKKIEIKTSEISQNILQKYNAQESAREWTKKNLIKTELDRVESPDKETKLLTYAMYMPEYFHIKSDIKVAEQDYIQHSIRAIRNIKDQKSDRILNRRWYFEQSKEGKIAWWCERNQFEELIKEANKERLLRKEFDDERLDDSSINYIFSGDLNLEEQQELIKDFTLENEREELMQEGYYFCIAEMHYPKAVSQMTDNNFLKRKSLWRDVMIWSPKRVTIRSVTNDRYHKPSEKIPNSSWMVSNDMTSLPNQVVRHFSSWLMDSNFQVNE